MDELTTEERQALLRVKAGQYLQKLRKNSNLSLANVCKELQISLAYLSEIERGVKVPSDVLISQIALFYNINEVDLFDKFGKTPTSVTEFLHENGTFKRTIAEISKHRKLNEDEKSELHDFITTFYEKLKDKDNLEE